MFILGLFLAVILFFLWCCLKVAHDVDEKLVSKECDKKTKK